MSSTNELEKLKQAKLRKLYQVDPNLYAQQVLKQLWTGKQIEIAFSVIRNQRTMVPAAHSLGKTHLGGGLTNYVFDCFENSISITVSSTMQQVVDALWKEIRRQRCGRPGLQPKAPRMEFSEEWFAVGLAPENAEALHGRHGPYIYVHFDEAVAIPPEIWDALEGLLTNENCHFLATYNPTDPSCRAYDEEMSGDANVIRLCGLDHPNIAAELAGLPRPFPDAISLGFLEGRIRAWCQAVGDSKLKVGDFEFPPNSGIWYRPGPSFEGRILGRWPSQGTNAVWTQALWDSCFVSRQIPEAPLQLGCDVARYGDDYTSIVARRGACVLHHETHNGWSTVATAGRLKELASEFAQAGEDPRRILVVVDDSGIGGGVTDIGTADDWNFAGINAAQKALDPEGYPNRRSELWFSTKDRADEGDLDLTRLAEDSRRVIRGQLLAQRYKHDSRARRVVEAKDDTKKRSKKKRSPDDADAFNLAFAVPSKIGEAPVSSGPGVIAGAGATGWRTTASGLAVPDESARLANPPPRGNPFDLSGMPGRR